MPFADSGAVRLHWQERGHGTPVLLVMGHRFSSQMWYPILPALAAAHRTVWFDNRGTGLSDTTRKVTVAQLAADAFAVMDAAGLEQAHVFGVSMGGVIVQEMAMQQPSRVTSLVLGCTGILSADKPRMPAVMRTLYYLPPSVLRLLMPRRRGDAGYGSAAPPERVAFDQAMLAKDKFSVPGVVAQAAAIAGYSATKTAVAALAAPALVLHGDEDAVVPFGWGVELAETLSSGRFVKLEGSGHNFLVAAREQAAAAVLNFLREVDTKAGASSVSDPSVVKRNRATGHQPPAATSGKCVQISLPDGIVEGYAEAGVRRFFSLPYAAAMTDENRFRAPQPAEPWHGVRDATRPGACAPQNPIPPSELDTDSVMRRPDVAGPDYLTLNVYSPDQPGGPRPVMVFIHGGSFVAGNKDAPVYDGAAFARDGVVCAVINYRLGIEGFLPIPGVPTNLGLRDMIAALAWLKANVGKFGGDPENVTVFGESGGAYSIAALLVSPLAAGLFRRAICQSGHVHLSRDVSVMQRVVKRLAKRLRIAPDRYGFLSRSTEQLLGAQDRIMRSSLWLDLRDSEGRDPSFGISRFMPVHGDDVLPEPPLEALKRGAGRDVDLLIGSNAEEANLFFVPGGVQKKINRWMARFFLSRAVPKAREALRAYGLDNKGEAAGRVLTRAMTDLMFRWMTRRTAELHQGRTFVYEFEWRSPALGGELGAAHAVELPFVFDTLSNASGERGLVGPAPPQALADSIHALWIHFAKEGSAPWPEYEPETRQVFSLTRRVAEHEPVMPAAQFLP